MARITPEAVLAAIEAGWDEIRSGSQGFKGLPR